MPSGIHLTFSSLFAQQYELSNFVLLRMWSPSRESVISEDLSVPLAKENNCEAFCGCEVKRVLTPKKKMLINLYNGVLSGLLCPG